MYVALSMTSITKFPWNLCILRPRLWSKQKSPVHQYCEYGEFHEAFSCAMISNICGPWADFRARRNVCWRFKASFYLAHCKNFYCFSIYSSICWLSFGKRLRCKNKKSRIPTSAMMAYWHATYLTHRSELGALWLYFKFLLCFIKYDWYWWLIIGINLW